MMNKTLHNKRSIWTETDANNKARHYITDQTKLPFSRESIELCTMQDAANAISTMQVRGAPLIGVTAAYGVALMMQENNSDVSLANAISILKATRPTAVNLMWALNLMQACLVAVPKEKRIERAWQAAYEMAENDILTNRAIGENGLTILQHLHQKHQRVINILTHCNAGALACVGYGTALAPMYLAKLEALPIHVYVDETRPRNQGLLTAMELREAGIDHTYIVDNAGGHLMQHSAIDLVIVGADRISANGDTANKIGTYLKALAAYDNGIPFYVAAPVSTIDPTIQNGVRDIEIEARDEMEVRAIWGLSANNAAKSAPVLLVDQSTKVANPGFDVTPARLITGIITERGIFAPANILDSLIKE
jgi:methylthioribose-1-phosphate isomerase